MATLEQVIDANVALRWLIITEPLRYKAKQLFLDARKRRTVLIGPPLLEYEVESSLQRLYTQGKIDITVTNKSLSAFYAARVRIETHPGVVVRTREIARQYNQLRIYDSLYATLTELRGCDFWTADYNFYKEASKGLGFVKNLADYPA